MCSIFILHFPYLVDRNYIGCRLSGVQDSASHGEKTLTWRPNVNSVSGARQTQGISGILGGLGEPW